jgi:hypothetical protein
MPDTVTRPHQVFALRHVARALDGFVVPAGPFDASGSWTATYDLVERGFRLGTLGALRLERSPAGPERASLRFRFRKYTGGGVAWATGEFRLGTDALSSPSGWSVQSWFATRDGQELEGTRAEDQVEVGQGSLRRTGEGLAMQETLFAGALVAEWGLFDAVQRLPRTAGGEWRFTLADRLGTCVKPGHMLAIGSRLTVSLGGRRAWGEEARPLAAGTVYRPVETSEGAADVRLQCYEHTGQGILPTTYGLDEAGRLLFVCSGMTGWILNQKAQL